ncbi:maltodextrin glucosidase [Alginatibacterium sediminis]|uniref:Maltodextrin glucosidase n=1 Tax=Alginatibacterium sediminis TaxID=2164068 RepID=A0A420EAX3_9ALTE|nr:maltodextrin glucosidase [Alginatibacterium sediminis]RKF17838.1 maltodextrin glucosidase [Alginatibacterium sediminis]
MSSLLFHPQTLVNEGPELEIKLYTLASLECEQVILRIEPDHEEELRSMEFVEQQHGWKLWRVKLSASEHSDLTLYCFKVIHQNSQTWLHASGESSRLPQKTQMFRIHQQQPPLWVRDQVFYQIFPERFANGDDSISTRAENYRFDTSRKTIVSKQWHEEVSSSHAHTGGSEFFGGDLKGITQNLDYLQDLGVTALYLNPIFTAPSNHKYDTADYFEVDPCFGGNEALIELREHTAERNMKIMLDAVVNHTSNQHPWMDVYHQHSNGAARGEASPHRNWFTFDDNGSYYGWKGLHSLPKLNFANPEVQHVVYSGENAILKHWLKAPYSIDAWRFDVVHMLGEHHNAQNNAHYVREFRNAIKQTNPNAYMIGEHFSEATQWLQGDQEDGAMNYYGFSLPVRAFLVGKDIALQPNHISAEDLALWLAQSRGSIPFANQLAQFNLLDSHDTERFLTLAGGNSAILSLAATLMFTYIGVPSIYYGDEIGLEGGADPDCRRPFPWDENQWDQPLRAKYQALAKLRSQREEMRSGDVIDLHAKGDVYVFARWTQQSHSIVIVNRGEACDLNLSLAALPGACATYLFANQQQKVTVQQGHLKLQLSAQRAVVLCSEG